MATIGGPNTEKDNLVFGYDTGYGVADNNTATRFYPGEPTTNQADTDAKRNWGTHNGATSSTTAAPEKGPGWKKLIITNINGNNYRLAQFPYLAHANGTTRTYSVEFDVGNLTGYFMFVDGTSGYAQTSVSGKGRYSITITASGGNKSIAIFLGKSGTHSSINHVIYYKEYQVEEKPHASLFTDSTRSDTASLIDLKRTTNIDVSNISFDSTGQPSFDETDDHITGTLPLNGLGQPHTVEMVFSCNVNQGSIGSRKDPFSIGNSSSHQYSALDVNPGNMNWYFYGKDTTFTNSPLMVADQFYHIVLSYAGGYSNNTNKKVWINGIQQTLSAGVNETPLLPNNPNFSVGRDRGRNTAYWPGEIPVWKVYQRALTEDEAKQNFNAYKNRFGI
jgi:hypothetical protein